MDAVGLVIEHPDNQRQQDEEEDAERPGGKDNRCPPGFTLSVRGNDKEPYGTKP